MCFAAWKWNVCGSALVLLSRGGQKTKVLSWALTEKTECHHFHFSIVNKCSRRKTLGVIDISHYCSHVRERDKIVRQWIRLTYRVLLMIYFPSKVGRKQNSNAILVDHMENKIELGNGRNLYPFSWYYVLMPVLILSLRCLWTC